MRGAQCYENGEGLECREEDTRPCPHGDSGKIETEVDTCVTHVKRTMFSLAFADLPTLVLSMDARPGVGSKMRGRGRLCALFWVRTDAELD